MPIGDKGDLAVGCVLLLETGSLDDSYFTNELLLSTVGTTYLKLLLFSLFNIVEGGSICSFARGLFTTTLAEKMFIF